MAGFNESNIEGLTGVPPVVGGAKGVGEPAQGLAVPLGVAGVKGNALWLLRGQPCSFTPEQRGQLLRYGLEEGFIEKLEART